MQAIIIVGLHSDSERIKIIFFHYTSSIVVNAWIKYSYRSWLNEVKMVGSRKRLYRSACDTCWTMKFQRTLFSKLDHQMVPPSTSVLTNICWYRAALSLKPCSAVEWPSAEVSHMQQSELKISTLPYSENCSCKFTGNSCIYIICLSRTMSEWIYVKWWQCMHGRVSLLCEGEKTKNRMSQDITLPFSV